MHRYINMIRYATASFRKEVLIVLQSYGIASKLRNIFAILQ